jgi:glycosyltransferase involved in cell wall biosynthesis
MNRHFLAISNHGVMMGGGEHSFLDLLSHLPKDWNVLAVVPLEGDLTSKLRSKSIPTRVIPLPSIRPWNIFSITKSAKSYAHLCRGVNGRFIYANGSRAAFYAGIAGRMIKVPVIWHCRMTGRDIYLDPIITRLSNVIIANSEATALRFNKELSAKVKVIHNGVDLEWLRKKGIEKPDLIHTDWKVILLVSRISKWKRHDLALAAFEHVASSEPDAHLICVGARDPLESKWWAFLQQKSLRSPFSSRIHWIGPVDDIRPWYRAASILLLPSMNEPFGRVLVESMAIGVPVVAMRSGGIQEIVRHDEDGLLVTHANSIELGRACLRLLREKALRERLGQSSKERAEMFSLEEHVRKMVAVFEEASG